MYYKSLFYLLGWVTLIVFPFIGWYGIYYFNKTPFLEMLDLESFYSPLTLIGLLFGFIYAFFILLVTQFPIFDEITQVQSRMIKEINLNIFDILFMSLCAGIGEEILFRAAIQTWLGPLITSFIFILVHGYFSVREWKRNLSGILVFPFILIIAYGYIEFGLWFGVAAHFSYDFLIFYATIRDAKF